MSVNIPASNFNLIQKVFDEIVLAIEDYDQTGRMTTLKVVRKTILFRDHTKLYITEILTRDGLIDFYQYDWVDEKGNVKLKSHSEPHPNNLHNQTETEPFHIHTGSGERIPNEHYQDLFSFLEFIRLYMKVG